MVIRVLVTVGVKGNNVIPLYVSFDLLNKAMAVPLFHSTIPVHSFQSSGLPPVHQAYHQYQLVPWMAYLNITFTLLYPLGIYVSPQHLYNNSMAFVYLPRYLYTSLHICINPWVFIYSSWYLQIHTFIQL